MKKNIFLFIVLSVLFIESELLGNVYIHSGYIPSNLNQPDSLWENQVLYNGRIWANLYYMVNEDQFLFSNVFLPGSLTIRGKSFKNVGIRYDLFKDEILTPVYSGEILQVNKETVDSFSLFFQNRTYRFIRIPEDSLKGVSGYFNVIYKGKTPLYVRYNKKIDKLAGEGKFDKFYQISRIYLIKDNMFHLITGKSDLLKVLVEDKELVRDFIRKNNLKISKNDPESFIPVVRYFDSLHQ